MHGKGVVENIERILYAIQIITIYVIVYVNKYNRLTKEHHFNLSFRLHKFIGFYISFYLGLQKIY